MTAQSNRSDDRRSDRDPVCVRRATVPGSIRRAAVPVPVSRATVPAPVRRVIVGVDNSESGLAALREAVALATLHGVPLRAVRAWALGLPRHGGRRMKHLVHRHIVLFFSGSQQRAAARALTTAALRTAVGELPAGLSLVIDTPTGDPGLALTDIAGEPGDLLVVGSKSGLTLRTVVHGSVSSYCLRHARCPVVVIRVGSHPEYVPSGSGRVVRGSARAA